MGVALLEGIKVFHKYACACVRVGGKLSESLAIEEEVRQGCTMSPCLLNIFMDGNMKEMKLK